MIKIQTDLPTTERTRHLADVAVAVRHRENEIKQKERQFIGSSKRAENSVGHERDGDCNCSCYTWDGFQMPRKENRAPGYRKPY